MDKVQKNGRHLFCPQKISGGVSARRFGLDFNKTELFGGFVTGCVLVAASALQQFGMGEGTDAGKAAFITALYVLIVPLIYLLFGKKSPLYVWISVAIAVVGFFLLCVKDNLSVEASDIIVLICSVLFSLHIIVIGYFSPKCDGVRFSCIQFLTAFVISTPITLICDGAPDVSLVMQFIPELLYYGVCSGGIAFTLQVLGQGMPDVNPAVASIILSLESVFGALGGAILLGEVMQPREYIGCAVVFAAVILSQVDVITPVKNKIAKRKRGE
jgi:drug/metabolite transporter (DMT)-like permease